MTICSSCVRSALTGSRSGASVVTRSMCSPITRRSRTDVSLTSVLTSMMAGMRTGERGASFGGLDDLVHVFGFRIVRIQRIRHQLRVADDGRQQIVEIVRDAA